ncbi:hypothetical protein HYS79_00155 [Patescibacteria group bacterium]|nr:hypothetical protein [Patescibacteria group bacterium]
MQLSPAQRNLLVTLLVLALLLGGYIYYRQANPETAGSVSLDDTAATQNGVTASTTGGDYTITEIPVSPSPSIPPPDYRAPVIYAESVAKDVREVIETKLAADVALLDKNNLNFDAWMNVAILHKIGGDYRGAETIWLYVTKQWPASPVAYSNLADLYQNFLHDEAKANYYSSQSSSL